MKKEKRNTEFKPSGLSIVVRANHLLVKIKSPLLRAKNHTVRLFKNKLRISIVGHPNFDRTLSDPMEYDLLIPKKGYRSIIKESFCEDTLTLKLLTSGDSLGRFIATSNLEGPSPNC